jgi:hypothetical protein
VSRLFRRAALAAALLGSLHLAAGAQEPKRDDDEHERIENRVVYQPPSKELARLRPLLGTWRSEETWREPGRWKRGDYEGRPGPDGWVTRTVEAAPGELSFAFREEGRGPMGGIQGSGLISWDPVRRVYLLDSISSLFPGIVRLTGRFEGADLVLSGEDTGTGAKRTVRLVLKGIDTDGWTETLSEKEKGRWEDVVIRRFRKAPAPAR